jgi:hypothetical protein
VFPPVVLAGSEFRAVPPPLWAGACCLGCPVTAGVFGVFTGGAGIGDVSISGGGRGAVIFCADAFRPVKNSRQHNTLVKNTLCFILSPTLLKFKILKKAARRRLCGTDGSLY